MLSGQVYDEEVPNVLSVRILLEGAVLEYEPRCVAKTPGGILTKYWHAGGGLDANTKENPVSETV